MDYGLVIICSTLKEKSINGLLKVFETLKSLASPVTLPLHDKNINLVIQLYSQKKLKGCCLQQQQSQYLFIKTLNGFP